MFREIKWFIQRGRRGWADCDVWSFDDYITEILIGGLTELKRTAHGYPGSIKTFEGWQDILDKMIIGFKASKQIKDGNYLFFKPNKKGGYTMEHNQELIDDCLKKESEALELFKEYFGNLWD